MPSVVFRGKAALEGIAGTFDVIVYPVAQTGKLSQNFEEEIVKDVHGFDAAWLARNEHELFDVGMKVLGDTAAHAAAGAAFLAPFATVTLSAFTATVFNGAYQLISGGDIDLGNTKVADINFKLRKYADATQNTSATTTPS